MQVVNYIKRVFPVEARELLKAGKAVEHPKTNEFSNRINIDLKSLEDYAQVKKLCWDILPNKFFNKFF